MKLTVRQINVLHEAVKSLDGREQLIADKVNRAEGDTEKVIFVPFKYSGKVRWNIAKNMNVLRRLYENFVEVRDKLIRDISGGNDRILETNREQFEEFNKRMLEVLESEEDVNGLLQFTLEDLNLESNDIPASLLANLEPLIREI